jgi:hypothetical protein
MKRRTTTLAATILALVLSTTGCPKGAIDAGAVLRATFHPDTVAALRLPESERACVSELFSATHSALVAYDADKTSDKWQAVRNAAAQFNIRQCSQNADFVAIVQYGQRILASVEPPSPRGRSMPEAKPDFEKVDKAAVEELKRKVDELKRR